MNQDVLFSQYLEELTDTITDLDHFNLEKIYAVLKELCIAFRVCKGVAEYYSSAEEERLGHGTVLVCYDSGEEPADVLTCRTVLSDILVADCKAFRAKGAEPWNEQERKRIEMVQRLMLTVVDRRDRVEPARSGGKSGRLADVPQNVRLVCYAVFVQRGEELRPHFSAPAAARRGIHQQERFHR